MEERNRHNPQQPGKELGEAAEAQWSEEPLVANARERWEARYARHLARLKVARLKIAAVLVLAIVLLDAVAQFFFDAELFRQLLVMRLLAGMLLLLCLAACFHPRAGDHAFAIGMAIVAIISVDLEVAIIHTSGYNSPFQTGLALLIVGSGLLVPFEPRQILRICALVWVVFLAPVLFAGQHISAHEPGFTSSLLFMICATLITVASSYLTTRLRRAEYFGRQALLEEKARSEHLLLNILPQSVAHRLQRGESTISDAYDDISVLFADLVHFTDLAGRMSPDELVDMLNRLFSGFDALVEKHGLEKVKTIGDAYMVVGGAPEPCPDHAERMARLALEMLDEVDAFNARHGLELDLRIGIHRGPAVAGVIGLKKFTYDLWGDTVNIASRMESHGLPGSIQVSEAFYAPLKERFRFSERGSIDIKGKGEIRTWLLLGEAGDQDAEEDAALA